MSYTSGFFDAIDQGGGDYDRVYSAATFAHYFSLLVKNGVFPDPSTGLQVRASSSPDMKVSVSPGNGWINGYYITVPDNSPEVLTVPTANPSLPRYDSVIMGLNFVDRKIELYIKSGAVSASPSPVTLQRDNDLYELELARISIGAGTASITQSLIIDTRSDSTRCGIVAGMIDQIDTTDLFAQYDNAFHTWFDDIQSQLSGDVATNLQNQINQNKQAIQTQADYIADIKVGIQNAFDVGGVFFLADAYSKTIKDALPCNGGNFDTETYADLFSVVGFSYGAVLPYSVKTTVQDSCSNACIDPVTGYLYVAVVTGSSSSAVCTVYVYDNAGTLLRSNDVKTGTPTVNYIAAYNNTVALTLTTSGSNKYHMVSLDGGLTWSTDSDTEGNSTSTFPPCITDTAVVFFYSYYNSGGVRTNTFTKSTKTWAAARVVSGNYLPIPFSTVGPGTIGYANFNGIIYKSTSPGSWTTTSISAPLTSSVSPITPILDGKFYFAYDASTIKEVDVATGTVAASYSVSGITLKGISGAVTIGGLLMLFDFYSPGQAILIKDGSAIVIDMSPENTVSLTTICSVPSGDVQAIKKTKGETLSLQPLRFNVPSVSISGLTAYIRTKKHTGV